MLGQFFDPQADFGIAEHSRPHWAQADAIVFITFRTHDSIPRKLFQQWDGEKTVWLQERGYSVSAPWKQALAQLTATDRVSFRRTFERLKEDCADQGLGKCLLREPELGKIVADALLHFDGRRYQMGDFVVMPNHVHLLAAFADEQAMRKQLNSWLHWTAHQINRRAGRRGSFWQEEPFDHLVRSANQYRYLRQYIADNPKKAGLSENEFHYRCLDET